MKVRIRLDTNSDLVNFVNIVSGVEENVVVEDGAGHSVSAKSLLGCAYAKMEFSTIYCSCERDISGRIINYII